MPVGDLGHYLGKGSNQLLQTDSSGDFRVKSSFFSYLIKEDFILDHSVEVGYHYLVGSEDWRILEADPENNTNHTFFSPSSDAVTDINYDEWGNVIATINGAQTLILPKPVAFDTYNNSHDLFWILDKQNQVLKIGGLASIPSDLYPLNVDPTQYYSNIGFESGSFSPYWAASYFTQDSSNSQLLTIDNTTAHSGTYCAKFYCWSQANSDTTSISKCILYQATSKNTATDLSFWAKITSQYHNSWFTTQNHNTGVAYGNSFSTTNGTYELKTYSNIPANNPIEVYAAAQGPVINYNSYITAYIDDVTLSTSVSPFDPVSFSNSSTWTCPAGVTSVKYMLIGPGGYGGAGGYGGQYFSFINLGEHNSLLATTLWGGGGGGGGRGQKKEGTVSVVPGHVYSLTISNIATSFDTLDSASAGGNGGNGQDAQGHYISGEDGNPGVGGLGYSGSDVLGSGDGNPGIGNGGPGSGAPGYNMNSSSYGGGGTGGRGCYGYPDRYYMDIQEDYIAYVNSNIFGNVPGSPGQTGFIQIIPIYSGSAPTADFIANAQSGYTPLTVNFSDLSSGSPTSWSWNFGGSGTSTSQNPSYTYSNPGTYTVSLTATNAQGSNSTTKTNYITVTSANAPKADFSNNPSSGRNPLNVQFTDRSTGSPTSWSWNFGDSETSTSQNPSHTYSNPGTYTVTLTATNSYGYNVKTKTNAVSVSSSSAPLAAFSGSPTTGHAPLSVNFKDNSLNSPTSWHWDFGDSTTSTSQNPSHTYSSPGNYTVQLIVTNAAGSDLAVITNYISVSANNAPVADFSGTPRTGTSPLTVQFQDMSTGSPTSWYWQFGDGNYSNQRNPSHIYSTPGNYRVDFIATNAAGSSYLEKDNYISVSGVAGSGAPVADFSGTPRTGTSPLTVQFQDMSTGSPTSWYWQFGDGNYSNQRNPSHIYSTPGNYRVDFIATNAAGSSYLEKDNYISVSGVAGSGAPVADFSGTPRTGTSPLTVQFQDMSTGSPTSWYWQFGDGNYSNQRNPSHIYSTPGNYRVDFIATNAAGSSYLEKDNYISVSGVAGSGAPVADFSGTPRTGTSPLTVQFQDMSTGSPTSWYWQFGDGNYSNQRNPSHIYSTPGNYRVDFIATNAAGSSYLEKDNYISVSGVAGSGAPVADFSGTPRTGTSPLTVQFQDMSTGSPTSWYWQFGDGNYSNQRNPSHIYSTPGNYRVDFIATNAAGSSYLEKDNYISVSGVAGSGAPVADFSGTPRTGTSPLTVQFQDMSTGSPTSWYWQFGDGNYSNQRNPSHIYSTPGNYRVDFIATNAAGSSYLEKDNYISVSGVAGSGAPVADFSGTPRTGTSPLTVQFQDMSTGSPTSWYWQFGDGNYSNQRNPSHIYSTPGNYRVDFIATNAAGSSYLEKDNYISVSGVAGSGAPVADFSGTPRTGTSPLTVQFQDMSTGSPTTWYWQFGDGNYSNQRNPSHIYSTPGNYRVDFIATNAAGSSYLEKDNYISVSGVAGSGAPVADFSGTPRTGTSPLTVQFQDMSTGSPTTWYWQFGDGNWSNERNPSHVYSSPGNYRVDFIATNAAGSSYLERDNYITVSGPGAPVAEFIGTPTSGSSPLNVIFIDQSTGSPTSWSWDFGDGSTSISENPSHTYSTPGTYSVQLTAINAAGSNSKTRTNYITVSLSVPFADFSGSPTSGSSPLQVAFSGFKHRLSYCLVMEFWGR